MEFSDAIRNDPDEGDPLAEFEAESVRSDPTPQNSAQTSATAVAPDPDLVAVLRNRLSDAESIILKSQETIAALHSRVETLVCSVTDLNKRLDRERTAAHVRNTAPALRAAALPAPALPAAAPAWHHALQTQTWQRLLKLRDFHHHLQPQDWRRALVVGTAFVLVTLTVTLVALLQAGVDPPSSMVTRRDVPTSPSLPPPSHAAVIPAAAKIVEPADSQTGVGITTAADTAAARPAVVTPAQRVRVKAVAPAAANAPERAEVPPSRKGEYVGTLSIDSEPSGEAFVNRRSVGRTPITIEDLKAGSHLIWIEREGYRRWTRVVEVPANRISRVSTALEPVR